MDMSLSKLQEIVKVRVAWHVAVYGVPKSWTWWLRNNSNNLQKKKKKIRVALVKCGKRTQRHSCFALSLFPSAHPCILTQSCPTVCDSMDHSPPGSSFYGIFQARILEWVAISSSRESSRPRDWTCVSCVSCLGKRVLYQLSHWENHIYVCVYMHDTEDLKIYQFPLFLLISFVSLHLWHFSLSAGRGFAVVDSIIPCCRWY